MRIKVAFASIVCAAFIVLSCWPVLLVVHHPVAKADALLLMAGSFKDRIPAVAALYQEKAALEILLADDGISSCWSPRYGRNLYQVEWAEEELIARGVPRQAITKLPFIKSGTYYDILAAREHIIQCQMKKVIIVTSDYHTRRSYWTARRLLGSYLAEIGVFPVQSGFLNPQALSREYLKLVYYAVRLSFDADNTRLAAPVTRLQ